MTPILLGNLASSALSALSGVSSSDSSSDNDAFDQLVAKLQQNGTQTTTRPDGSQITTQSTAKGGQRVVSETSAPGQTLTEGGSVSPKLMQSFLNNLFTSLKADGATVTNGTAIGSSATSALNTLEQQVVAGASSTQGLTSSFSTLMQNAGINTATQGGTASALKSFLAHASSSIASGQITSTGINVRA